MDTLKQLQEDLGTALETCELQASILQQIKIDNEIAQQQNRNLSTTLKKLQQCLMNN